ncbi:MAG: phosphate signaling complex protein PhoU [Myxococcota bacterium]
MPRAHTDREFENELRVLRQRLLAMAGWVEEMIANSVRSVVENDPELARETIELDRNVNRAELETDELCMVILARRQPMASDLRFITLALKMVTDLERIGDLAVNISERALDLCRAPQLKPYHDIPQMAEVVQSMVHDAIDAFVKADASKAYDVIARDDTVDDLYVRAFRDLMAIMIRDPGAVERGIHVQSIAKFLERMADHSTNLAEQVIFMVKGKDVRHSGKLGD